MGPVEYLVIEFPGNKFNGEIIPALSELTDNGTIRIIDLIFIQKDAEGNVVAAELNAMSPEIAAGFETVDGEIDGLLNSEDVQIAGEALNPDSSAAMLVFENVWATRFRDAVVDSGGRLVANARIPAPIVEAALAALSK